MCVSQFQMNIYKNKFLSRFGLMHMIATNLCVWLNVLILETSHEIHESHVHHGFASGHNTSHGADAHGTIARHKRGGILSETNFKELIII